MKKFMTLLLAAVIVFALCACGAKNETAEIPNIEGEYQDEVSQRAMLTMTKTEGNAYDFVISWSSSATETTTWEGSGEFDGEKLEYTDGVCETTTYDDNGVASESVGGDPVSGTFTLTDEGKLEWVGVNDGETGTFVKLEK